MAATALLGIDFNSHSSTNLLITLEYLDVSLRARRACLHAEVPAFAETL